MYARDLIRSTKSAHGFSRTELLFAVADSKDLSILIFPAGKIRMCEPKVTPPEAVTFCA